MDLDLEMLRQASQDLLQRLRMKQEEIRNGFPSRPLLPEPLQSSLAADRCVPSPRTRKENQVNAVNFTAAPGIEVFVEPLLTGSALSSCLPHSSSDRGVQQQVKTQEGAGFDSSCPGKGTNITPVILRGGEISRVHGDGHTRGSPGKESFLLGHGENRKQFALRHGFHEKSHPEPSLSRVQNKEPSEQHVIIREPRVPKSALLTPRSKQSKKEARHVTFQPDPEEDTTPVNSWSAQPFLGYDWIAGLLDTKSSVTEKSEEYFDDLQEFRQANREACIHQQPPE
uniref:Uncharacterized protein n=1 Tax=Malurus cyaneus samueli TaxID=2593467 RepID=A0A8C5U9T5_9PASS